MPKEQQQEAAQETAQDFDFSLEDAENLDGQGAATDSPPADEPAAEDPGPAIDFATVDPATIPSDVVQRSPAFSGLLREVQQLREDLRSERTKNETLSVLVRPADKAGSPPADEEQLGADEYPTLGVVEKVLSKKLESLDERFNRLLDEREQKKAKDEAQRKLQERSEAINDAEQELYRQDPRFRPILALVSTLPRDVVSQIAQTAEPQDVPHRLAELVRILNPAGFKRAVASVQGARQQQQQATGQRGAAPLSLPTARLPGRSVPRGALPGTPRSLGDILTAGEDVVASEVNDFFHS